MIYLITGLPGNGKTLYTIWHVEERAKRESRPVYYSGINDLSDDLGWIEFDGEDWYKLPEGSIIVIDEAQRIFRPRNARAAVPEFVAKLETHRHSGYDLYLITQHPALIDTSVRRLSGCHRHIVRTFGLNKSVIHEFNEVRLDCERRRSDSSKTNFSFPKHVFKYYKSAEMHTHRIALPKQVYYFVGFVLIIGFLLYYVYSFFSKDQSVTNNLEVGGYSESAPIKKYNYYESFVPRIENHPHTAPRYDELTRPVVVPVISGCLKNKEKCTCYTQRATKLDVDLDTCLGVVKNGAPFYDFIPDKQKDEIKNEIEQEKSQQDIKTPFLPEPAMISEKS